jgi:hypothetical protein
MGFDPCNRTLKIQESIGTPTPNMGVHLRVWGFIPSHSLALPRACNVPPKVPSWLTTLQALALVASPRLGLWQWSCETTLYGSIDSTNGRRGGEHCWSKSTAIHRGDGRSTIKGNGDEEVRIGNYSEEKMCNLGQSYTFKGKVLKN